MIVAIVYKGSGVVNDGRSHLQAWTANYVGSFYDLGQHNCFLLCKEETPYLVAACMVAAWQLNAAS